ncbi:MAG: DMT family transporter [Bacteroidota bacterium]
MKLALFILLALVAGMLVPVQAALNVKLGKAVSDPMYGAFLAFVVGTLGLLALILVLRVDFGQIQATTSESWVIWLGGFCGAFFVAALIILTPRLGVALTLGLTVAGQMGFSLLVDHYGWFGSPVQEINWFKVGGVLLIVGGVWLVQSN